MTLNAIDILTIAFASLAGVGIGIALWLAWREACPWCYHPRSVHVPVGQHGDTFRCARCTDDGEHCYITSLGTEH